MVCLSDGSRRAAGWEGLLGTILVWFLEACVRWFIVKVYERVGKSSLLALSWVFIGGSVGLLVKEVSVFFCLTTGLSFAALLVL